MNLCFKLFDKLDFLSIRGKLKKDENSEKRRKFWEKMKILKKDENSEKR